MGKSFFDEKYVSYWKNRVGRPLDGSKVADDKIVSFFLNKLGIKKRDVVLDLGCGHGRLFPILRKYTENIIGLDITYKAINTAVKCPYLCVVRSSAEETNLPAGFFDKVIAWAVYDTVEQEKALIEQNRILKNGGYLLITGKNNKYSSTDKKAFIAERNAKLKKFPNHFTNVHRLLKKSENFGFKVFKSYAFPKRGDFGEMTFVDLLKQKVPSFYEFLLILKKIGTPVSSPQEICYEYSETAIQLAKKNNFKDIKRFFKWHKERYGDE